MAQNYILLERIELNANAASVTFNNIPQSGYTDLKLMFSLRTTVSGTEDATIIQFNSSSTGYTEKIIYATGSAAGSATRTGNAGIQDIYANGATSTANIFSTSELIIPNYTSANYKSMSFDSATENNATLAYMFMGAGLWSNTAAITSIGITPATASTYFVAGSTFSLYGLAAVGTTPATAPKASGGNIVTDGTYWYHTFVSTGTFTPFTNLSCDYLVIAGGGGGGAYTGSGGGGAGGLRSTLTATGGGGSVESKLSLTPNNYKVIIGAGGTGELGISYPTNGSDSTFSTVTSTGGGRGAGYIQGITFFTANSGGSGGGGAYLTYTSGAAGTTNQGYAGGNGNQHGTGDAGGGGGGAGAAGSTGGTNGGIGGDGVAISAFANATGTGVSNYYAGGGGGGKYSTNSGGAGGAGGGGAGSREGSNGTSGTANTGGGGGGSGQTGIPATLSGGAGGSGIVIVRYTVA